MRPFAGRPRLASALIAAALVAVAGLIVAVAPTDSEAVDAIRVDGRVGETLDAQWQTVRVDKVRAAATLDYLDGGDSGAGQDTSTEGLWLVIDLTAIDRLRSRSFIWAVLEVGDRRYHVFKNQPGAAVTSFGSNAGIPYSGSLLFELPASVLSSSGADDARLVMLQRPDPVSEGVPVVHIDLTSLQVEDRADVAGATTLSFAEADMK